MVHAIARMVAQSARVRSATLSERIALARKTPGPKTGGQVGRMSGDSTSGETMPPTPTVPLS